MNKDVRIEILSLVERSKNAFVSSIDGDGFPNTKAMFALQHDGMATHYFSTNRSARRTSQFLRNPNACIYFCDEHKFSALMLVGTMEVCTDRAYREMLWREGSEVYYPSGIDDEDYCVLEFTAHRGNYYHSLATYEFTMEVFQDA